MAEALVRDPFPTLKAARDALVELEYSILGYFIGGKPGARESAALLAGEGPHFEAPLDLIAATISNAIDRELETTAATVMSMMADNLALIDLGGKEFLISFVGFAKAVISSEDGYNQVARAIRTHTAIRRHISQQARLIQGLHDAQVAISRGEPDAIVKILSLASIASEGSDADSAILDSGAFVTGFIPPDYVVDGIIQRGFLYSMTSPTGGGKTAISLRIAAHVALGRSIGTREVQPGKCLMLIGENPDDVRARWIGLSEQMGFFPEEVEVHFLPQIIPLRESLPFLRAEAERRGPFSLVVVDTSAAYFPGDEENSNVELGEHARALRALTTLHGKPAILANCHPTKNASSDNLLPRGGGAFVAEVDGNLTCAKREGSVQVHWQGKFRGPDFDPIAFELVTAISDKLKDSRNRHVPTVIARPLSECEQVAKADAADRDLHHLLTIMASHQGASIADLAKAAGWTSSNGGPYKSKVARLLGELKRSKLVSKEINTWTLTPAGKNRARRGEE